MTVIVPQGMISDAQDYLRQTIAASTAFQTWVGATDLTQALNRVHHFSIPPPKGREYKIEELQGLRPYVAVWTEPGYRGARDSVGAGFHYKHNGVLMAQFWEDVPKRIIDNPAAMQLSFQNTLGLILEEIENLAGSGNPYLNIEEWEIITGPSLGGFESELEQGTAQVYEVRFTWGNS